MDIKEKRVQHYQMDKTINNRQLKFIPKEVVSFDSIVTPDINKRTFLNDIYEKYDVNLEVNGELIVCNDVSKMKHIQRKLTVETYTDYLNVVKNRNKEKDKWIYNIIDGVSETGSVLYRDQLCIIMPTYTWNGDVNKLHMLCIATDRSLRSIRDLRTEHIDMLKHMKQMTLQIVKTRYNLNDDELKIFFHYVPSTYQLHIHFVNINFTESMSSVEYSHDIDNVIFNLQLDSDYYKKIVLKIRKY